MRYHIDQLDAVAILDALDTAIDTDAERFTDVRERFLKQHPEVGDTEETGG